jgi:ribosomal protein S8
LAVLKVLNSEGYIKTYSIEEENNKTTQKTIKVLLNILLSYQAIRVEKTLLSEGKLDYQSLVTIKKDDFKLFTQDDFINIIGSENVKLYKF